MGKRDILKEWAQYLRTDSAKSLLAHHQISREKLLDTIQNRAIISGLLNMSGAEMWKDYEPCAEGLWEYYVDQVCFAWNYDVFVDRENPTREDRIKEIKAFLPLSDFLACKLGSIEDSAIQFECVQGCEQQEEVQGCLGEKIMRQLPQSLEWNDASLQLRLASNGELWEQEVVQPPRKNANGTITFNVAATEVVKPKYKVGDILYVRETWAKEYYSQLVRPENNSAPLNENAWRYIYRALNELPDGVKWKPSIHMPKEAARLFLQVTEVRAERLQDISAEDCIAEGIPCVAGQWADRQTVLRNEYAELWDSTVLDSELGKYGWAANPWVWVYGLKRLVVEKAEAV